MIELNYDQLKMLRNHLSFVRSYVPYQERGDMPFHATVWYPYHQDLLDKVLNNEGAFVAKIWKGSEEKNLVNNIKKKFKHVSYFKPDSSRKDSAEIFIVARNFIK